MHQAYHDFWRTSCPNLEPTSFSKASHFACVSPQFWDQNNPKIRPTWYLTFMGIIPGPMSNGTSSWTALATASFFLTPTVLVSLQRQLSVWWQTTVHHSSLRKKGGSSVAIVLFIFQLECSTTQNLFRHKLTSQLIMIIYDFKNQDINPD